MNLGISQKNQLNQAVFRIENTISFFEKVVRILFFNFLKYLDFMDFGQIIYIVAIVAYFLYRASSKKKSTSVPDGEDTPSEPPKKDFTFEELLREIREAQTPTIPELEPEPVPIPKSKSNYKPPKQDRPVIQSPASQEVILSEGLDYEQGYSNSNQLNSSFEYPSLVSEPSRPISYELPKEQKNPYAELLKNPKSFRDAVVVSEILKPKHF